ncbi:hypothetical protein TsFJ059_004303 [Trichoderma semiorbis]|uniref:Uncharacterized protein n=1 Tax=Trichoderma semiorbis TaxID=1491008 RepID=A0A9P8HXK0_9HYPO|nr:hypothetical protein TsFJ059_004303 [Trichoderma semiorbis]
MACRRLCELGSGKRSGNLSCWKADSENEDEAHECSDERLDQQHERHELSFAPDWAALANLHSSVTRPAMPLRVRYSATWEAREI